MRMVRITMTMVILIKTKQAGLQMNALASLQAISQFFNQ